MKSLNPWRILVAIIIGPAVAVGLGVYMELADAPIANNHYTSEGHRIVCTLDNCWE